MQVDLSPKSALKIALIARSEGRLCAWWANASDSFPLSLCLFLLEPEISACWGCLSV